MTLRRSLLLLVLLPACQATNTGATSTPAPWTDRIIAPITSPVTFESPTIQTNARPIFAHHSFPSDSIFGGGALDVYALQLRYAVNDRFAIIATKDGYFDLQPDTGSNESGMADVAGGFKYAFIDDPDKGLIATAGLIYEGTNGDKDVFQGNGDGTWRPFVSAGLASGDMSYVGSLGLQWPNDRDAETTSFDWHLQGAWHAPDSKFAPVLELSGIHYISGGEALAVDFEGGDVINLGASGVGGNDLVTGAVGLRWNAWGRSWLGLAWETPVFSRDDLFDDRVTADLVVVF